jgi:hypothetical protein
MSEDPGRSYCSILIGNSLAHCHLLAFKYLWRHRSYDVQLGLAVDTFSFAIHGRTDERCRYGLLQ